MVHERKRTNKRSPIRVNRKLDRSLKREKKKKHNGGRTLKKNRKNKNKFKDYIQKGGSGAVSLPRYKTYGTLLGERNYTNPDSWEPFTYQNPSDSGKKYLTFYHNSGPNSLYEFTNFFSSPFNYDGVVWKTAEHYFQSCKSIVAFHLDDSNNYRDDWLGTMRYYNSLNSAGEVFNAGSQINFNTHLKPKFWGGFRPGENIGLTGERYFKQPSALKYQIMLNALYQKFLQNNSFRDKLKQHTEEYILVEDSRSNDDSWGNGFKRKRGKEWSSEDPYYKGLWTGQNIDETDGYSDTPYNSDNHRNNILGITLTCLGKLFIKYDNPLGEGVDIKEYCGKWIEILQGSSGLGYDVSDLFNIFPWEHWTTSLKRNNTSIVKVNGMIQKLESAELNKYKTDVLENKNGYTSITQSINYDIKIEYGEVNGCEIFDYLIENKTSPLYTYYFTDTGYTKKMLEEKGSRELKEFVKEDEYYFMENYDGEITSDESFKINESTKFVALSENGHIFYEPDKNAGIILALNAYIDGNKSSVYKFEIQKGSGEKDIFEVRFGEKAHSSRIPCEKSMSGIIQVNARTGDTRIVITKEMYSEIIMSDPFSLLLLTNLEKAGEGIGGLVPFETVSSDVNLIPGEGGKNIVIRLGEQDITTIETESKSDGVYVDGYLTFVKDSDGQILKPVPSQERYMGAEPLDFKSIGGVEQVSIGTPLQTDVKVPVIGYKYERKSNKYLAQKYTDVLFLFNDHLTDYNGMGGNAGIRNLPNAFGIPLGCYNDKISESYPGKTEVNIEKSIKDDDENLLININYTVNSGNKFNGDVHGQESFINLLNKLIQNIKELIRENNYKAVVFNCADGDDSQPEFGIQLFSKEKGYNRFANKKMIQLLRDNISNDQKIECINDTEIEGELNKLETKINPMVQAKEKHEEYEKEKATKPKTSLVTPTPTPTETLPDLEPLTEIKYRKVFLTNYKDKYNFIKKHSDLVFEEELTERIDDHECLEKLLLLDRFIDYTNIQRLPKPTFTERGEFEEYFDGDEGKIYGKDVSKNILVCQIKFLGNMNMYIIYNTKDKFVLCSPCFDPPVFNIDEENSTNFSIPFRNGCKYLPIHIVDFKRNDNYMELTFYMNGKKYKYESDYNLEENFESHKKLLDEAKENNNKEQIIEKRLIESKTLVKNMLDDGDYESVKEDSLNKGILSYKPDGSDSKQEYYFDVKINEGESYETVAKGTCFYNSEFKNKDSEELVDRLKEYQGNMDEKTKKIMEDYSRRSTELKGEYEKIREFGPTVVSGPTVVKESTSFFKKVEIKLPVKKTYSTPEGISEKKQHIFLDFAKNFKWNEMFQMLETTPILVNSEPGSPKRWTALHQAAFAHDLGVYQRLINDFDANPNIINRDGHIASYYLTNEDADEQSDTFYKIKVLPGKEVKTISYTGEMLTIPVGSFYYYKKISKGKKIIIGYNNTYDPPLDIDGTVYQIPEELLTNIDDYNEFKLSSGSEVTRSVRSGPQITPRIDSPIYPEWGILDDYHKNKLCHTFLDLIKRWKDEYKNLFDNYASNKDAMLELVKFTGDLEEGSEVGNRWPAYVQLHYWISSSGATVDHHTFRDEFKELYNIKTDHITIPGKGIFKDITDYDAIEKIVYSEQSEPSEPSEKFIEITKINNSFTQNVFNIYKYNFLTIDISNAIKIISKQLYDNIKKETLLILPRQIESEHIDNIKNHLRYRHPLHIGGPIWNRTNNVTFSELLGYDEKTANQNDYNVRGIQGIRDTPGEKIVDKMWYGILGYTEWIDPVPEDPKLLEYRPTEKSAYFLHTWGVNLESNRTPHYYYCFVESIGFNIERYKTLLDNMFSVVENAGRHLLDIYPNNLIIIRISQLGLGAWANYIPDDKKHEIIEYYRMKLNEITTRNENIMIQFVMFPKNETYWIRNGDPIYTENNHDPFGKKVDIGTEDYKLIIVNAWDEGSFIGNGGSQDNTLDGWTVAGGSDLYGGFYYGIGDKRLGYYAKNYSYLHNFFFQPQLLNEKKWYPLPVVAEVVKGTPVQVVEGVGVAPGIPTLSKKDIWTPNGGNGRFKCWLNAPLYSILQNEEIRNRILEEHKKNPDDFIKILYDLINDDEWNQEKYLEVIQVFEKMETEPKYKLEGEMELKLFNADTAEIQSIKDGKYYDAGKTLTFLKNALKIIGIDIYYIQSIPGFLPENGICEEYDKQEYRNTGKPWKNCVDTSSNTKLISLVQSENVIRVDTETGVNNMDPNMSKEKRAEIEAAQERAKMEAMTQSGHFKSFIPITRKDGFNTDFNKNYVWILVDAIGGFQKTERDPEPGNESYSFYIFLKNIETPSTVEDISPQVFEEKYIKREIQSRLSTLLGERKSNEDSLNLNLKTFDSPDSEEWDKIEIENKKIIEKMFKLNNGIVSIIINNYQNKSKTYDLNKLYLIIIEDLYGNDKFLFYEILEENNITENKTLVYEIFENNIKILRESKKRISDTSAKPEIDPNSADSVEGYVELNVTNSKGDGNCGFHSVIYAIVMQTQNGLEGLNPNNNTIGIFNDDVDVLSFNGFCKSPNKNIILQNDNGLDINIYILKTLDIAGTDIFHETHNPENYISIKRNIINLFRAYILYLSFNLNIERTIFKSDNPGKQQELENFRVLLSSGIVNDGEQIIDTAELDAFNGVSIISFLLGIPIVNSVTQYDGTGWQIHLPNIRGDSYLFETECNPISLRNKQIDGEDDLFPRLFYYRIDETQFTSTYRDKSIRPEHGENDISTNQTIFTMLNASGCEYFDKNKGDLKVYDDGNVFKKIKGERLMTHKYNKDKIVNLTENFLKKLNPKPLFFNNIPGHYQYSRIVRENPERNTGEKTQNQSEQDKRLEREEKLKKREQDDIEKAIAASLKGKEKTKTELIQFDKPFNVQHLGGGAESIIFKINDRDAILRILMNSYGWTDEGIDYYNRDIYKAIMTGKFYQKLMKHDGSDKYFLNYYTNGYINLDGSNSVIKEKKILTDEGSGNRFFYSIEELGPSPPDNGDFEIIFISWFKELCDRKITGEFPTEDDISRKVSEYIKMIINVLIKSTESLIFLWDKMKIRHCDLNERNILINKNDSSIKLIDFVDRDFDKDAGKNCKNIMGDDHNDNYDIVNLFKSIKQFHIDGKESLIRKHYGTNFGNVKDLYDNIKGKINTEIEKIIIFNGNKSLSDILEELKTIPLD